MAQSYFLLERTNYFGTSQFDRIHQRNVHTIFGFVEKSHAIRVKHYIMRQGASPLITTNPENSYVVSKTRPAVKAAAVVDAKSLQLYQDTTDDIVWYMTRQGIRVCIVSDIEENKKSINFTEYKHFLLGDQEIVPVMERLENQYDMKHWH